MDPHPVGQVEPPKQPPYPDPCAVVTAQFVARAHDVDGLLGHGY
jgi:hypothetical protein